MYDQNDGNNGFGYNPYSTATQVDAQQPVVTINQASLNNEASLAMGGYDPAVEAAVSASARGVGADPAAVLQAKQECALMAQQAVADGKPRDKMRYDSPHLDDSAIDKIYEKAAQQAGKTPEEIKQAYDQKAQQDMQMLQQAAGALVVGGLAVAAAPAIAGEAAGLFGAAAATDKNNLFSGEKLVLNDSERQVQLDNARTFGQVLQALGGNFDPQAGLPGQQRQHGLGIA